MIKKIRLFVNKYLKRMGPKSYKRNSMAKEVLFCTICLLLVFAGVRLYSLYDFYTYSTAQETESGIKVDDDINVILKEFLMTSYKNAYFLNKNDAYNLQINLIEEHGANKVYENLVKGNYNADVYETFTEVYADLYNANSHDYDEGVFIANDEGFIYVKTNNKLEKFDNIKNDKKVVLWKDFLNAMNNPEVTKHAFADSYYKAFTTEPVIIRLDGDYNDNKYYTMDDLCDIYRKEGIEGLKGYGFLVSSTLTEKGDIYGNVNSTFMQNNDVHKLYVYKYVDVTAYLKEHEQALSEMDETITDMINSMQMERKISILISCATIFLLVLGTICLMVVYRELNNIDCLKNENEKIE